MGCGPIGRYTDDFGSEILDVLVVVTEVAGLGGAAWGIILRVEVDNDPLAEVVGERDCLAICTGELDVDWGWVFGFEHMVLC